MLTPILNDVHGGADLAELQRYGLRPDEVLDFSANLNPFGPSPAVRETILRVGVDRYPDRDCTLLRNELARRNRAPVDGVLVGNGSTELFWLLAIAHVRAGDGVAILGPAFGGCERAACMMKAEATVCAASSANGFRPPWQQFARLVDAQRPRLACVTNPNSPTGQTIAFSDVIALAARCPNVLFALDEAYIDCLSADTSGDGAEMPNLVRLRSLTKAHGLAGLRLGYAIGSPDAIATLRDVQPPWSVNALAQAAGLAALLDQVHLRQTVGRWRDAAVQLIGDLRTIGFAPVASSAPFFLVPVADAARTRHALLGHGLLVRDCTSFGLPQVIRISSRSTEDNARLVEAMRTMRAEILRCPD
jgi:histidinol-phosphate/aromatic aminotransferase/cobyric acid decarboxylase-like protein